MKPGLMKYARSNDSEYDDSLGSLGQSMSLVCLQRNAFKRYLGRRMGDGTLMGFIMCRGSHCHSLLAAGAVLALATEVVQAVVAEGRDY